MSNRDHPVPRIACFNKEAWAGGAAALLQEQIDRVLKDRAKCSVLLTGGRTAGRLYSNLCDSAAFRSLADVDFYFGDERCVPASSPEANFRMVMQTLFGGKPVPAGMTVHRMEADAEDRMAAAKRYEDVLPPSIDVGLFTVGGDGHIASLFPGSPALRESCRRVVPTRSPVSPHERLSITPMVITQIRTIFVLAPGTARGNYLGRAMEHPNAPITLPARLVLDGIWVLDNDDH